MSHVPASPAAAAAADPESLRSHIRSRYAAAAGGASGCCGPAPSPNPGARVGASSCCGGGDVAGEAERVGYDAGSLSAVPEGANLGLGCGNPTALGALQAGEVVLDLGSGGGIDCFLAARAVGAGGRVIGVDMTPEMIERARRNAREGGFPNVEFRLGEIEHLPVADAAVDVVISNCVINLVPDKRAVFAEMRRVLRPGGRAYLSDIALTAPLPEAVRNHPDAIAGCVGGALLIEDYRRTVIESGFAVERFDIRGSQMAEHAERGTTSPDPVAAQAMAVAAAAMALVRSVDIVARKPA